MNVLTCFYFDRFPTFLLNEIVLANLVLVPFDLIIRYFNGIELPIEYEGIRIIVLIVNPDLHSYLHIFNAVGRVLVNAISIDFNIVINWNEDYSLIVGASSDIIIGDMFVESSPPPDPFGPSFACFLNGPNKKFLTELEDFVNLSISVYSLAVDK
jgi:hypothetical protein